MPTHFWLEALTTAVFLANRLPHSSLQFQIPYTLLFHTDPDYFALKPFGCACFPWLKPYNSYKLLPKYVPCVFLGYCSTSKGYRFYDPVQDRVYVSRHVKFEETCFPFQTLTTSTASSSFPPVTSSSFPISLTSFIDILVQVLLPSSVSSSFVSSMTIPASSHDLTSVIPEVSSFVPSSSTASISAPLENSISASIVHSFVVPSVPLVHPMQTRLK